MPLPFLLGVALGAGAVVAYNKSDKVKNKTDELACKSKKLVNEAIEKTKKNVNEVKENLCSKKDIKEKVQKEDK